MVGFQSIICPITYSIVNSSLVVCGIVVGVPVFQQLIMNASDLQANIVLRFYIIIIIIQAPGGESWAHVCMYAFQTCIFGAYNVDIILSRVHNK